MFSKHILIEAQNEKQADRPAEMLVARRGFEPPIFALRGRCPKPLDDRAVCHAPEEWLGWKESNPHRRNQNP